MKNVVLLDSDSNTTIACNKNYAECAWDTKNPMSAETNSGVASEE